MSAGLDRPASGDEASRPGIGGAGPTSGLSLVVGRALGTVVVTVHGTIDPVGCELLEGMLGDLIDGQGNLSVAVDLAGAIVEPHAQTVFIAAARRARRHGAKLILKGPPADTHQALHSLGLADVVEIQPRTPGRALPAAVTEGQR